MTRGWQSASVFLDEASQAAQEEWEQSLQGRLTRPWREGEPRSAEPESPAELTGPALKAMTAREERLQEFAELIRDGKTLKEAAALLHIAPSTAVVYEKEIAKAAAKEIAKAAAGETP